MTNQVGLGLPITPVVVPVATSVPIAPTSSMTIVKEGESEVLRNKNGLTGWQLLSSARRYLRERMPYLDSAVLMLSPVEVRGLGTVAVTDTMILLVDMTHVIKQTVPALAADLLHEVSHVLRDTGPRTKRLGCYTDAQRKLSNIAADLAINVDVEAAGLPIISAPVPGVSPQAFGLPVGLTHEEYYWALRDKLDQQDGKLTIKGVVVSFKSDDDGNSGNGQQAPSCGHGWCGSGGGMPVPGEPQPNNDPNAKQDPNNPNPNQFPGRSPAEIERAKRSVAEAVKQAAAIGRGNVPAGWVRWADESLRPPRVPWQQKIARLARRAFRFRAGACDLKYNDVSRRQAGLGYGPGRPIMPKFKAPVPEVWVMMDTSGSMGDSDFAKSMPEIDAILRAVGAEVTFASVDAHVHEMQKVKRIQDVFKLLKGGGGTDFNPFFKVLESTRQKPSLVMVFTDGDAYVPQEAPTGASIIWVLTRRGARKPAAWGEAINLADELAQDAEEG